MYKWIAADQIFAYNSLVILSILIFDQQPKCNFWPFKKRISTTENFCLFFFIWIYFVGRNKICFVDYLEGKKTHDLCPGTLKIKIIIDTIYINTDDKKKSWHQKEDNRALITIFFFSAVIRFLLIRTSKRKFYNFFYAHSNVLCL